jgi:hypothetical protein
VSPHGIFEGRHTHRLKSWPDNFAAALAGRKTFEIRRDDRAPAFQTGDLVMLQEWRPPLPPGLTDRAGEPPTGLTGRQALFLIGYVERSPVVVPAGWCGFELIAPELAARIAAAVIASPRKG